MHPLRRIKLAIARRKFPSRNISGQDELPLEAWTHNKIRDAWRSSPEMRSKLGKKDLKVIIAEDVR